MRHLIRTTATHTRRIDSIQDHSAKDEDPRGRAVARGRRQKGRQDEETNGVLSTRGRCQQQKSGGRVDDLGDGVLIVRSDE